MALSSEPCGCPKGQCREGVDLDEQCINRLPQAATVERCEVCEAGTWHYEGRCLRCHYRRE